MNPLTSLPAQAWGMSLVVAFYSLLAAWRWMYTRRVKAGSKIGWRRATESVYSAALYAFPVLFGADAVSDIFVSLTVLSLV